MMNEKLTATIFFAAGLAIGYRVAEKRVTNKYIKWHKSHRYSCWDINDVQRVGDYPQVFVLEKLVREEDQR